MKIYRACNKKLARPEFSARNLLRRMNVYALCTTNDPTEDLKYHKLIADDESFSIKVLPTFCPDKAFKLQQADFNNYLKELGDFAGVKITTLKQLKTALEKRLDFFIENGCMLSDHSVDVVY